VTIVSRLLALAHNARRGRVASRPCRRPRRTRLCLEPLEDRLLLNNRFIVPLEVPADNVTTFHTLQGAFPSKGLASGDIIEIEPGSMPGNITFLPAVQNVTIRGNLSFPANEIPAFSNSVPLSINAAQQGLTLQNVNWNLSGGELTLNANATIATSQIIITGNVDNAITLNQTTASVLRDNVIINQRCGSMVIVVGTAAAGSQNLISGNTVINQGPAHFLLLYFGANVIADQVLANTFVNSTPMAAHLVVGGGVNGLVIRGNTFRNDAGLANGVSVLGGQNIQILDNSFELLADATATVAIQAGQNGTTTSAVLARNAIRTGVNGTGIDVFGGNAGTSANLKIEGNDFLLNKIGVNITSSGGSVSGVDMGGGSQGSAGANNFRVFTASATNSSGAIVMNAGLGLFVIQAQRNLFRVADPNTVVWDNHDDPNQVNVVTGNNLTGNAAFVQSLYRKFLHRVGSDSEIAAWVNLINGGMPAATVANSIVRSPEALGVVVDGLYLRFLQRQADPPGRQAFVNQLVNGSTLENVERQFLTAPEYLTRFNGDRAFVTSLYYKLLERLPSQAELDAWGVNLATTGRSGVASAFLSSTEHRTLQVQPLFTNLLKRTIPPSAGEVSAWVNTGLDLLSITAAFAGSGEFQSNS
jgi:hypothetical protein